MITNTIAGPEFNTLIARMGQAETSSEFEATKAKLTAFIDSWAFSLTVKAVEEFKAVCKYQGLVACNEKMLDTVLMATHIPSKVQREFEAIKTSKFDTNIEVPKDLSPYFTVEDPDLNQLLNDTAFLVAGDNNMDTGIAWFESLEKVLARLQADDAPRDSVAYGQVRYRVHMTVARVLGHSVLKEFKSGRALKDFIDLDSSAGLLDEIAAEFKCAIPANVRQQMLAGSGEQLSEVFYDMQDACPKTMTELLDRLDVEQWLGATAPASDISHLQWRRFRHLGDVKLAMVFDSDDNELDDPTVFFNAIAEKYKLDWAKRKLLDAPEVLHMHYPEFVTYIIKLASQK